MISVVPTAGLLPVTAAYQSVDGVAPPGHPIWWRDRLELALDERRPRLALYDAYYYGHHRMAYATGKYRETFGDLFAAWADNWCDIVVDASVERMHVVGFRFGSDQSVEADREAWDIWQANNLDAYARQAHLEAIKSCVSYLIVAPPDRPGDQPRITAESPAQVIVQSAPGDRRVRLAALKKWVDERGITMATLYLPNGIYRWQSADTAYAVDTTLSGGWVAREEAPFFEVNPLGVVPVIPLENSPTLTHGGRSDLERVIPVQDAVNKILNDGLIASEFGAFQQRVLLGVEVAKDENGNPIPLDELRSALSRLWVFEDKDATATTFPAVDLSNFYHFARELIQHMATQTRIPVHYFLGLGTQSILGEGLKSAETGLVAKVRAKMVDAGESWEEAMRLAFRLKGDEARGNATDAEVIWRDPETRTESERSDALVKKRAIGIPLEALWVEAGYTPQQIARFQEMRRAEAELEQLYSPKKAQIVDGSTSGMDDPIAGDAGAGAKVAPARLQQTNPSRDERV